MLATDELIYLITELLTNETSNSFWVNPRHGDDFWIQHRGNINKKEVREAIHKLLHSMEEPKC